MKKIIVGSDHRGFALKQTLTSYLRKKGYLVDDRGTYSQKSCDYPVFADDVSRFVAKDKNARGILICNSGLGMTMAANKVKGVRAANCLNPLMARYARGHNDANVLVLGAGLVNPVLAKRIINVWLKTKFEGGRHKRRIAMFD